MPPVAQPQRRVAAAGEAAIASNWRDSFIHAGRRSASRSRREHFQKIRRLEHQRHGLRGGCRLAVAHLVQKVFQRMREVYDVAETERSGAPFYGMSRSENAIQQLGIARRGV